ncbi:MAG: phosphoribosyltransferase family protein [Patescibacteria group bacterium]
MLKSIKILFLEALNLLLPERKNFSIVNRLSSEDVRGLPKATPVEDCDFVTPLFNYKDRRVSAIIWELKYKNNAKPLDEIGRLIYEEMLSLSSDVVAFNNDAEFLLIPVPITTERRIERGYNQSEYLAKAILENDVEHCFVYAPQFLTKIKDTPRQSHSISKSERILNIKNSFFADERVQGKYVVLVDDVVTTGSTLTEARNTLLLAGAKDVFAFTIAH